MSAQPEALRLADALSDYELRNVVDVAEAATELRRLHEVNAEWKRKATTWLASPEAAQQLDGYRELAQQVNRLGVLNADLLEALHIDRVDLNLLHKAAKADDPKNELLLRIDDIIRRNIAAIAKAEGGAA